MQRRSELAWQLQTTANVGANVAVTGAVMRVASSLAEHANSHANITTDSKAVGRTRSLKTRAVDYLSRREYSRAELANKLSQPTYQARQAAFVHQTKLPETPSAEAINAVLDDLQRQGFLNDTRFAQGLVNRKANKHGAARVLMAMAQHQLNPATTATLASQLKGTELVRCYEVWARKFEPIHRDGMDYTALQAALGKQGRFLMQRGFHSDAVRKVLNGWKPDADER